MSKNKMIVLEGLGGSGKSTILKMLERHPDIVTIKELPSIYPEPREIKSLKKRMIRGSVSAGVKRSLWFLHKDLERELYAYEFIKNGYSVAMERNHLSTLAFSYTVDKLYKCDNFSQVFKEYMKIKGFFPKTDLYIILRIPYQESLIRQEKRKRKSAWPWNEKEFASEYLDNWFHVKEIARDYSHVLEIDTSGNVKFKDIAERIYLEIKK